MNEKLQAFDKINDVIDIFLDEINDAIDALYENVGGPSTESYKLLLYRLKTREVALRALEACRPLKLESSPI
jgi:hypothetical protein